ncbi:MAG TPA: radical SAM protein [Planctomycetota bacterium]|nr:radical SAM protein [Planctomycetota bacterium]
MRTTTRLDEVDAVASAHPDLPFEAILKEDLLRLGVDFSDDALAAASGFKPKSYFIFSFDRAPISAMGRREDLRAPEEIALVGGPRGFRRTIVSVRLLPGSPHLVDVRDGKLVLLVDGTHVADVMLQDMPSYYRRSLRNGKPITEMTPTIEWGYLVYLTVYRKCQYFGFKEECQFCDINENFRQQKAAGRPYNTVKEVDEILEALEIVDEEDVERRSHAYTITGGSITRHLHGLDEAAFYARYARAINERFPGRWISKLVVQALPREALEVFRDAGVQIYHPNYEVWDKRLFSIICPGKDRYIGRDEWMRRVVEAADVFGPSHVIPNFVAGVEMSRPHGFESVEDALRSTGEGLEFFMSRGITPRFTTWCPEPLSVLGRDQGPAPLAYHAGLLRLWRDTLFRHGLPAPPGYGAPGAGSAVFSVSAFLDALPPDTPVASV